MKKIIITSAFGISFFALNAQVEVTSKSFDLESQNKHKNWQFGEAGIDSQTGTVFIKMKQPECDKSETFWTTTYRGLKWNVDKLVFDKDFNYIETKSATYKSSEEALLNNENIFGKKYKAIAQGSNSPAIGKVMASASTPMPKGPIDNSFMFTTIVTGTATMTGFKLASSIISVEPSVTSGKNGPTYCNEYPVVVKKTSEDAKEEKGQRWIPMFSNPVPNGGNILFNTSGVNKEEKQHYIFRKYDENTTILKEQTFTFDYQCLMYAKEIEKAPGVFDYVFVTLPINYKKSKLPTVPANNYEYFYVDGSTYEIKERLTIVAPNSQWLISQVYAKDGAVYLCGESGKTATTYADFAVPNPKDYPNFQLAKIENGTLVYVKTITPENIKASLVNVNGEKTKSDLNFKVHAAQMDAINGKFIYGGRYENVKNAIFNEKGDLEAFIIKNAEFSENYFTFSKDKKTMYCLVQNVLDYNKWDSKTGVITPKKARQVITSLSIVTYNLENKTVKYEDFKNENWGVKFSNQILMDNDDQLLLLGTNITKKAKESEIVFITIKK
jgi:hypothetical protein